jgi:hypothetical protein
MKYYLPFLAAFFAISCNNSSTPDPITPQYPGLFVTKKTFTKVAETIDSAIVTSQIGLEYFDIDLIAMAEPAHGFVAQKTLEEPALSKPFRYVYQVITDSSGRSEQFASSTEFLNYMAVRGYEMQQDSRIKFGHSYTFRLKPKQ